MHAPVPPLHRVRALSRVTGISPGALHRELAVLVQLGALQRNQVGRQVFYSADPACPVLPELTGLLRKTAGLADVLREALLPLADRIRGAFVYGSMATGDVHAHSDVDVMVVGTCDFAEIVLALEPAQATLRREINPTVLSREDFMERRDRPEGFVARVWKEPRIWLTGNADELG